MNLFVAGFIGSPAMNFATAPLVRDDGPAVTFAGHRLADPGQSLLAARPGLDAYFDREVILGIRPSDFEDAALADAGWPRMPVTHHRHRGAGQRDQRHLRDRRAAGAARQHRPGRRRQRRGRGHPAGGQQDACGRPGSRRAARSSPARPLELAVDNANLQFFDAESGLAIGHPASASVDD